MPGHQTQLADAGHTTGCGGRVFRPGWHAKRFWEHPQRPKHQQETWLFLHETARPKKRLLARTAGNDVAAFECLMRRHNSRLFRVARAILKDDAAAEDAVQEAYLQAFRHSGTFRGEAQVSTWLTRIVINQSLMRLRRRKRDRVVVPFDGEGPGALAAARDRRTS